MLFDSCQPPTFYTSCHSYIISLFLLAGLPSIVSFSIVFFAVFGIFATQTNTFFAGVPSIEQQVTETGDILLNSEPASTSETLTIVAIIALVMYIMSVILNRYGMKFDSTENMLISAFAGVTAGSVSGFLVHLNRYSNSETALLAVLFFWSMGSIITVIFKTIYPFALWHFANNFFLRLNHFVSDDKILVSVIIFIVLYILFYIGVRTTLSNIKKPSNIST